MIERGGGQWVSQRTFAFEKLNFGTNRVWLSNGSKKELAGKIPMRRTRSADNFTAEHLHCHWQASGNETRRARDTRKFKMVLQLDGRADEPTHTQHTENSSTDWLIFVLWIVGHCALRRSWLSFRYAYTEITHIHTYTNAHNRRQVRKARSGAQTIRRCACVYVYTVHCMGKLKGKLVTTNKGPCANINSSMKEL